VVPGPLIHQVLPDDSGHLVLKTAWLEKIVVRLSALRLGDILALLADIIVVGGTWPTITPGSARRFWASRLEDGLAEKIVVRLSAHCLGDILALLADIIVVGGTWPTNTPGSRGWTFLAHRLIS
jgi:hypothetical protein